MTISIIDSYSETYTPASGYGLISSDPNWLQGMGQSFTAIATYVILDSAKWYLKYAGSAPIGSAYAKVYNYTGTPGSTAKPTGSALATSDAFDASTVSNVWTLETFTFSGANRIELTPTSKYILTIEFAGTNYLYCAYDYDAPVHSGNSCWKQYGAWDYDAADLPFYVYGEDVVIPHTKRQFPLWL